MDEPKPKRGRPPVKNPSVERVHFRCTPAEKARYKRKAGKRGISAWLKRLADDA